MSFLKKLVLVFVVAIVVGVHADYVSEAIAGMVSHRDFINSRTDVSLTKPGEEKKKLLFSFIGRKK